MLRCSVGRGKKTVERAAVDRVRAGAGLEDHARDGGLALAGGAVARAGGEVDGGVGDRLGEVLVVVGLVAGAVLVVLRVGSSPRRASSPSRTMSTSRSAPGWRA